MYSLPWFGSRHGRASAVTGSPAAQSESTPTDQYWPMAFQPVTGGPDAAVVVVVVSAVAVGGPVVVGVGSAGHDAIWPIAASVLTDATLRLGSAGSGRAVHGCRSPTLMSTSLGALDTSALKSKKHVHWLPPPATSSHRLALIEPLPSRALVVGSSTATGDPTARPAVEPPRESAQPTHVPSARRTASANGSVWAYGGPPGSTPPAVPATAAPSTVPGAAAAVVEVVVVVVSPVDEVAPPAVAVGAVDVVVL